MDLTFAPIEVRVLGALIEKSLTTPEYYPLSINSLANACNQKSNREPVVNYDDKSVLRAVEGLRDKSLTMMVTGAGSRVSKYKHTFARRFQLNEKEVAVLCLLMLRGPQTVGEIRGRSSRLFDFANLQEVEEALNGLMRRGEGAFVVQLPRQPGRKESRYAHLFCGPPEISEEAPEPRFEAAAEGGLVESERLIRLEAAVEALQIELEALKQKFAEFRQQFE